jgi:hypothetical protein
VGPTGAPRWPFPGRPVVEALRETAPQDAPASRDDLVASWIRARALDPVTWIRIPVRGGLEVQVSGDAISFGGIRLCCSQRAAQWVADSLDALTPTTGISDAIWRAANVRLPPMTIDPDPGGAVRYWLQTQDRIQTSLSDFRVARLRRMGPSALLLPPDLIADVGKDYVLVNRLIKEPTKCAIYGWRTLAGVALQNQQSPRGASLRHYLPFFDYSHAVRVVHRRAWLNGGEVDLAAIYSTLPELVITPGFDLAPPPIRHPAVPRLT